MLVTGRLDRKLFWLGLTLLAGSAAAQQPGPGQQGPGGPPGVPVSIGHVTQQDVPIIERGIGTVQSLKSALVRARVDGVIQQIAFTEGQDVKAGDLLVVIDPRPYQAAFDQASAKRMADQATLNNSRRDLGRTSELARSEFATRQSLDTQTASVSQGMANLQADDAAVALAKLNLDFARVTAPFSGRVGLRLVDEGNLVHANDAAGLVTINQVHPISAVFTLPQDLLPAVQDAVRRGTPLAVAAYSSDDKTLLGRGTLLTTDNAIDSTTGTIRLKATFPNVDDRLWPGQFVNAHLELRTLVGAVVAPSPAIMHGVNGLYVYVAQANNTVAVQPVEVGQDDGRVTVVTKGLDGTETVVVGGQSRLSNGARITVNQPGTKGS